MAQRAPDGIGGGGRMRRTPPDLTGYVDLADDNGAAAVRSRPHDRWRAAACSRRDDRHDLRHGRPPAIRNGLSPVRHARRCRWRRCVGRCFVTNTRAVFVCHPWELGGDLGSATAESTDGSDGSGTTTMVRPVRAPASGGIRLCARRPGALAVARQRVVSPAAGDASTAWSSCGACRPATEVQTSVFLSMVPARDVDVDPERSASIVDMVCDDRLGHHGSSATTTSSGLGALDVPAAGSCWQTVCLPGGVQAHGVHRRTMAATRRRRSGRGGIGLVDQIHP